eukprot:9031229-Alexandrium_andersonii.AAC.1
MHRRMGKSHAARTHLASLVVTNQCIFCKSAFASRASAQQHTRYAFVRGYCMADMAFLPRPVVVPPQLQCPECGEECENLIAYNSHVLQHVSLPQFICLDTQASSP